MNSLKFKLFVTGILISIMPMITYQVITFYQSSKTLQITYAKELKQKTELTTLLINKSIFHTLSDFKIMSENITEWINLNDIKQISNQFYNLKNIHQEIDSIDLFEYSGNLIFSTNKSDSSNEKIDIANKMLKKYLNTNMEEPFIYEHINNYESKIFILNKINSNDIYFVLIEVNFKNIELLISNFEDEILGQKPILILNEQNKTILSTSKNYNINILNHRNIPFKDLEDVYSYVDHKGDKVLTTSDKVFKFGINNALGWSVVTSIPIYVINDEVFKTLKINIIIGLVMTLLIFTLLTYLTKNISNSIKVVLDFAKKLESGKYSTRLKERNSIQEFYELTSILNKMSYRIEKRDNELVEKNKLLHDLAYYDALTNIPNRMLFQDRLNHAIDKAKRNKSLIALLFIDLDQFKYINDSFGHDYGDEILKVSAYRLKSILREEDTVARLGGDEFTIIIEDIKDQKLVHIIASKIIEVIKEPIVVKENDFSISCSVGISMYPNDATDKATLIKYADTAMYKSKSLGRSRYQFYSYELTKINIERIELEKEIYKALKNDDFIVLYQPQVNSINNKLSGIESLIRWNHSVKGLISPTNFLPFAQEIGIIDLIDEWVIKTVMIQVTKWHNSGYALGLVAINLSIEMLEKDNFIEKIKNLLIQTKCKAQWIELELTEGQVMKDHEYSIKKLKQISDLGIHIAIDDFGTGYSSLSYLKHLPINKLKIDKSFVDDLPYNLDDVEIVKTIISLAKGLHLDILAEGVEFTKQKDFLNENGCVDIQGYLYSKPIPAFEMEEILSKNELFTIS